MDTLTNNIFGLCVYPHTEVLSCCMRFLKNFGGVEDMTLSMVALMTRRKIYSIMGMAKAIF